MPQFGTTSNLAADYIRPDLAVHIGGPGFDRLLCLESQG